MHRLVAKQLLCALLLLTLVPALASAATAKPQAGGAAAAPVKVTEVEGIQEYRLANGLRVLLFPDPSKETITVNITYLVGSRHEGYGETGMAHLLEHMVFKGSPKHQKIPDELTAHGARPNGTTWWDRTNYFETFSATRENLDWALDLEADRMVNSFIRREDLDSEMTVVRNEFELGENSPQAVLLDRIMSTAYLWHNYGKSTIGARSDIEQVPIPNLRAFYERWYQPDNAVLVVAGKIDPAATLQLVVEKFGAIPKPARALPHPWTVEPAQDGERAVTLRRVGDLQAAAVGYHVPSGPHPDFAAVEILGEVLGATPAGRLYKALVEPQHAASVSPIVFELADPGAALFFADVRKDKPVDAALAGLIREVEQGLGSKPATSEEVERARARLLKQWDTTMRSSERAAITLSEWTAMGDWRLLFLHRDRLEKVTTDDVQRVAAAYFRPENRTSGVYLPVEQPQRAAIPATPDVVALVADYKGRDALASGEEFDPSPSAIETKVLRRKLPSGASLVMVPKQTRGGVVQAVVSLHLGDEASLRGRTKAGELAGAMLTRGTTTRTRQQIQDELDRLRATLNVGGRAEGARASLEVPKQNLEAALRLLADVLQHPAFPASELTLLAEEQVTALEDARRDPFQQAIGALNRYVDDYPLGDPRHTETTDESIAAVRATKVDDLRRFHTDFYGASAAEVAIVGDFDPAAVEPLVGELFGGWKSAKAFTRVPRLMQERQPLTTAIEIPDKESAVFAAGLPLRLQDDDPDYPALVLANFMTGGGFLNSRLAVRLRQKDGVSYGVSSNFGASPFEPRGDFFAFAIFAPQNADKAETGLREELARVVESGFTAEEIAAAKSGWLQRQRVTRAQEAQLANVLASRQYAGRTLAWDEQLEKRVEALTPEQIAAAVKKYWTFGQVSFVKAGSFTAKPADAAPAAAATKSGR